MQFQAVDFLSHGELWLFAPESAVGLGDLYSFAGAHADDVGFQGLLGQQPENLVVL